MLANQGLFPVSHIQLTSRCAGAGREHSQADHQAAQRKYSTPWTSRSVYKRGLAGGAGICEIRRSWDFRGSRDRCSGTGCATACWAVRKIVLCIACFAYSSYSYYYFYSFLSCIKLSLSQPTSITFCPFSSPSHCGGGGLSERLSGPSRRLPAYTTTAWRPESHLPCQGTRTPNPPPSDAHGGPGCDHGSDASLRGTRTSRSGSDARAGECERGRTHTAVRMLPRLSDGRSSRTHGQPMDGTGEASAAPTAGTRSAGSVRKPGLA